jgi:purine nucleosidase
MDAPSSVSIIMTGPCSNLVAAIKKQPAIKHKIKQVVWMGGAFKTSGNVQTYQHNGSAEWNAYWDPKSSKELFEMNLPLVCIPLDVTNHVPVTKGFLSELALQADHKISNLAGQFWALTIDTIPNYYYTYFMWDMLAMSFLAIPHEFTVEKVKALVSERPPNAGQTIISEDGYEISVATNVNKTAYYNYVLTQFRRN